MEREIISSAVLLFKKTDFSFFVWDDQNGIVDRFAIPRENILLVNLQKSEWAKPILVRKVERDKTVYWAGDAIYLFQYVVEEEDEYPFLRRVLRLPINGLVRLEDLPIEIGYFQQWANEYRDWVAIYKDKRYGWSFLGLDGSLTFQGGPPLRAWVDFRQDNGTILRANEKVSEDIENYVHERLGRHQTNGLAG